MSNPNTKKRYFEDVESYLDYIPLPDPPDQAQNPSARAREEEAEHTFAQRVAELCSVNRMVFNGLERTKELENQVREATLRANELTARNYALQIDNSRLKQDDKINREKISALKTCLDIVKDSPDPSKQKMFYACRSCRKYPVLKTIYVCCTVQCHSLMICAQKGCNEWARGSGMRRSCNPDEHSPKGFAFNEYSRFCFHHSHGKPAYIDEKVLFEWRNDKWERV